MKPLQNTFMFTCFALTCLLLGCGAPLFGDTLSAIDVIDRSENEYKKIKYLQLQSEAIGQEFSENATTPYYEQKNVSVVRLDRDKNFAYLLVDIIDDWAPERKSKDDRSSSNRTETYFLDGTGFTLRANSSTSEVFTLWAKAGAIHGDTENTGWKSVFFGSVHLTPMGIFQFEGKTASIFDSIRCLPQLRLQSRKSGENESYVISGENDIYRFTITIDPDKNFAMSSYSMEALQREKISRIFRKLEYNGTDFVNNGGLYFPKKFDLEIEVVDLMQVSPPPAKAQLVEYRSTMTSNIKDVSINEPLSKKDYGFKTNIANGTTVYVEDAPQIEYIWYDGEIVPKTSELMLAIARDGHKFMPGPREPRFWMMAVGILLIVYACSVKAYQFFKSKEQ